MPSAIREQISKLADHIPGLRSRRNMVDASMPARSDNIDHRYAKPEALREILRTELKFENKKIFIWASESRGLDVSLPRKLTDGEIQTIFNKLTEYEYAQRVPTEDNDD